MKITFEIDNLNEMQDAIHTMLDLLKNQGVCLDTSFDACLVSSELITNVIRHQGGTAKVECIMQNDSICISVSGGSKDFRLRHPTLPDVFAESGRGLYIVDQICNGRVEMTDGVIQAHLKMR